MTATLSDVASKLTLLKTRRDETLAIEKQVELLVRQYAPEEAAAVQGCFPRILSCPVGWLKRRGGSTRVATTETVAGMEAPKVAGTSRNRMLNRFVGVKKENASESQKIVVAMEAVSARVTELQDRVALGRERALMLKKSGKQDQAIRELKKSKGVEKQLGAARAALDTLERQQDLVAESALQRELATALESTTSTIKQKHKGLVDIAEKAVDDSTEVADEVQDVAQVFEGLAPIHDGDDEELLEELAAMMMEDPVDATLAVAAPALPSALDVPVFPSAPKAATARARERETLLAVKY